MADRTNDERLRYHATRSWTAFDAGTYDELQAIAAELLAARKRIVELDEVRAAQGELLAQLPPSADQLVMAEMDAAVARTERDEARAELLAARARIAKLEQEPPMTMIDFGVGVNWKGLHEDMQRLRAERDALRAQLHADDQRAWEALGKPEGTHETTNVQRLCAEVERMRGMLALLCAAVEHSAPRYGVDEDWRDIDILRERMDEAKALLRHKETNQ